MLVYLLALLIGVVAGLRALTAPAAVCWAAYLGALDLSQSWLSWLSSIWAVVLFTILALVEYVTDQLPSTPSRKVPMQFGARIVMGAAAGGAIGVAAGSVASGAIAGVIGAILGTFGGAELRSSLAKSFGRDQPAAFIEDAVAIIGAAIIMTLLP